MADIQRHATANWQGSPKDGGGELSGNSGQFTDLNYTFPSRFEDGEGTNPEELIGAAHAACFNMVVAKELSAMDHPPERLETDARVSLREDGGDYEVAAIHLETTATVDDVDESTFQQIVETAREGCPISRLLTHGLADEITVEANIS